MLHGAPRVHEVARILSSVQPSRNIQQGEIYYIVKCPGGGEVLRGQSTTAHRPAASKPKSTTAGGAGSTQSRDTQGPEEAQLWSESSDHSSVCRRTARKVSY